MAAEWILQAFAYEEKRLAAFVGSGDVARARAIAKSARELVGDERILDLDLTLEGVLGEIATGKLQRAHGIAYRIALEAIAGALATRVRPRITTYALKPDVGRVLVRLGQKTLGSAWNKPAIEFPSKALGRATTWPMAITLAASHLKKAAAESASLPKKRAELDARVLALMPKDPSFSTDVADVIEELARIVAKVARTKTALMILVDGEQ